MAVGLGILLVVAFGFSASPGAGVADLLGPLLDARDRDAVGVVTGSAFEESRTPGGAPRAYGGLSLLLLPHSGDLEGSLDAIRSRQRESPRSFTEAHREVSRAIAGYRQAVAGAGGSLLLREAVADAEGRFRFDAVPAGRWMIFGSRETYNAVSAKKVGKRAAGQFVDNLDRAGYGVVTYWRVEVDVEPGRAVEVRLHDRNAWMTAVREDLRAPGSVPRSTSGQPAKDKGASR
jgi:hypothetical protein